MKTMRALVAGTYGEPDTYEVRDLPIPSPKSDEVLVRVSVSTVNMADLRVARGELRQFVDLPFPHVLGADFSGTVVGVGSDVTRYGVGDEIFGYTTAPAMAAFGGPSSPTGTGAMAEFLTVKADTPFVARRPSGLSREDAAVLATTGLTARALAVSADVQAGERVLVVGATGGVGTALLTMLATSGANITATSRSATESAIRALGAHHTVGFDPSEYPSELDAVLNAAVPGTELGPLVAALRPGGRLLTVVPPPPNPADAAREDVTLRFVADANADLGGMSELASLALEDGIRAVTAERFSLERAAAAYARFTEGKTLGKLVVTVREAD